MTNQQKTTLLRDFISYYYEDTLADYNAMTRVEREHAIHPHIFASKVEVLTLLVSVCRKMEWVEMKCDPRPFNASAYTTSVKFHLCDEAYEVVNKSIRFVTLRTNRPHYISQGTPNYCFLKARNLSMDACFDIAYRKVMIDEILEDLANDPVSA